DQETVARDAAGQGLRVLHLDFLHPRDVARETPLVVVHEFPQGALFELALREHDQLHTDSVWGVLSGTRRASIHNPSRSYSARVSSLKTCTTTSTKSMSTQWPRGRP